MINIRSIRKLTNDDGFTLKKGKKIIHKTGYQVATNGVECTTPEDTIKAIKAFNGECGVWFNDGIYYVDKCHRVKNLRDAIALGIECNQKSIMDWKRFNAGSADYLIWLPENN